MSQHFDPAVQAPPKPRFDWVAHAYATLEDTRLAFMLARDVAGVWYLLAAPGSDSARDVGGFGWLRLATPEESRPWQIALALSRAHEDGFTDPALAALGERGVAERELERLAKIAP